MFVRAPEAAAEIAVMGRERDRSKGAGKTHDAERDSGAILESCIEDTTGLLSAAAPIALMVKAGVTGGSKA